MTIARPNVKFESVFIPYEPNKLIRNNNRFNVNTTDIRFAVYLSETILLIDRIIDFGNGISAARPLIYAFVKRAKNRTDDVIPRRIVLDG